MSIKERHFDPLPTVSLVTLVPQDHFYRHLDSSLAPSFVRNLVSGRYASIGRPSYWLDLGAIAVIRMITSIQ